MFALDVAGAKASAVFVEAARPTHLVAVAVTVSCMPGWFRPAMASSDCWHQAVTTRGTIHFAMVCMLYTALFKPVFLNQHKPDKPPTRSPPRPTYTTYSPTHPPTTRTSAPNSPRTTTRPTAHSRSPVLEFLPWPALCLTTVNPPNLAPSHPPNLPVLLGAKHPFG